MGIINDITYNNVSNNEDPDHWRVDTVIECLDITDNLRHRLMYLAPRAYTSGVYLKEVWDHLTPEEQNEIETAYLKEVEQ